MRFTIDPHSPLAPFEQLRSQVVEAIDVGDLPAGSRLPTVRALALELGLAPNTVARAYRQLEQACVVRTRGRLGTFVEHPGQANERAAFEAAQEYARRARELGVADDDALRLLRDAQRGLTA